MSRSHTAVSMVLWLFVASMWPGLGCDKGPTVVSIRQSGVYQDPQKLAQAQALPVAAKYLAGVGLAYQRNPSFCGPTTVINVLRSTGDARVGADNVFEGTTFHWWNAILGMPLDRLAELMRQRTGYRVTVLRDLSVSDFRQHLRQLNTPNVRYAINFHRGPLFGSGHGHHSPLGAYLESEDLVLVLDVNRDFRPWLVSAERLYQAMDTVDSDGNRKRGLLRIELASDAPSSAWRERGGQGPLLWARYKLPTYEILGALPSSGKKTFTGAGMPATPSFFPTK